ncbi:uncharacterized protein LOC135213921 [Macrobrachium nipponense]|uniref:uncharacterized protein LOC135213921 n=1 Tax=Macrobrachium nipponense TaxID=159736 RepID=UPI0030C821F2
MELTAAHGQSPVHHSSPSPLTPEDEPPADLTSSPPLHNQELPDQESAWSLPLTTVVAAAGVRASPAVGSTSTTVAVDTKVGCSSAIPQATPASAPDGVSGLTPESLRGTGWKKDEQEGRKEDEEEREEERSKEVQGTKRRREDEDEEEEEKEKEEACWKTKKTKKEEEE